MPQFKKVIQRKEWQKIKRRKNAENYHWCSFCQTFHEVSAFYRDSTRISGIAHKCKLATKAKYNNEKFLNLFRSLPKKEQQLYS